MLCGHANGTTLTMAITHGVRVTPAKLALQAVSDGTTYAGAAFIHPSLFATEDAKLVQAPVLLIPTKDEADLVRQCTDLITKKGMLVIGA